MDDRLAHSPTLAAPATPLGTGERFAPDTAVGEYVVDHFLGAGAMGEVYAGHHPVIGKKVAIKVIKRELAASEEAAERFTREARAVNQVDHPNVIDVFAYGRLDDGRLYLVMDLVAGESLRARLRDGAIAIGETLAILDQIAEALDAAHRRGVVHRDLKPDNVMLGERGVFVLDFGIAKLVSEERAVDALTGKGTWLGTPAYMAPEQWSTDGAGPASDRYALGVIAFEMLSGHLPFAASSVPGMMEQHFRAPVPVLSLSGSTTPEIDAVMQKALAKDPDARYATAAELVGALRDAAGTGQGKGAIEIERPNRRLPAMLGVATLAIGIAGVVMISKTGPRTEAPAAATPAGTLAVEVTSTPNGALVSIDGRLVGATPTTLHLAPRATVALAIAKPGYLPSHRTFDMGTEATALAVNLGAVTRFEGVWKLPSGELRALERDGDRVAVSKVASVTGKRELYKVYPFVASETGVAFALDDEVIDPRAPDDKTCHVTVHVEYRYDAAHDQLQLVRPTAKIDFVDGQCVPRAQPIATETLTRVDATTDEVEIAAPAGDLKIAPPKLRVPSTKQVLSKKATAPSKKTLDFDPGLANQKADVPPPMQAQTPQVIDSGGKSQNQANVTKSSKSAGQPQAPANRQ